MSGDRRSHGQTRLESLRFVLYVFSVLREARARPDRRACLKCRTVTECGISGNDGIDASRLIEPYASPYVILQHKAVQHLIVVRFST